MPRRHYTAIHGRTPYGASSPGFAIDLVVPEEKNLAGALCAAVAPQVFFPEGDEGEFAELVAKRICSACPVRMLCLNLALGRDERFGIYGGLTTAERDALTGRVGGCGTAAGYRRHRNLGDPPCRACHAAKTAETAAKKARRTGPVGSPLEAAA